MRIVAGVREGFHGGEIAEVAVGVSDHQHLGRFPTLLDGYAQFGKGFNGDVHQFRMPHSLGLQGNVQLAAAFRLLIHQRSLEYS